MNFKLLCLLFLSPLFLRAQPVTVGDLREDALRDSQLLGRFDGERSFLIRPVVYSDSASMASRYTGPEGFSLLDPEWKQQYTSFQPYGWNDGSMIPASGYQMLLTAGMRAKLGILELQLKPEVVLAANKEFNGFPASYPDSLWRDYYTQYLNRIDDPERFGTGGYSRIFAGQSSLKLAYAGLALGVSTENIWWGPGRKNSLLMSNTAPGFPHFTFNTTQPLNTPAGALEWQIIAGRLKGSGFPPPDTARRFKGDLIALSKPDDWRYLSGITVSYHPRGVKGLFLGFSRCFYMYERDLENSFIAYFPFLSPFEKSKTGDAGVEDLRQRDQLLSFYGRWFWEEASAEIYLEYGRNDHAVTGRDFLLQPEHSDAYTAGITKIFPLYIQPGGYLRTSLEITRLSNSATTMLRAYPDWYLHHQVRDGYTNLGQELGAGIGSGSNGHFLEATWINSAFSLGVQFDQLEHNAGFYRYAFNKPGDERKWIDHAIGITANKRFGRFDVNGRLRFIRSSNYQWQRGAGVSNMVLNAGITMHLQN